MAGTKKPARKRRDPRITVSECSDLTDQEASAYGSLFVAKVGDFESDRRSTQEKAIAEAEAHLASLETDETGA